jgi:hypothetical protein
MVKPVESKEVRLARNWSRSRVLECLQGEQKTELIRFINERYSERFFDPIRYLRNAPGNSQGYGFAIMALCCLLVETLECYRKGLPSSHARELDGLEKSSTNKDAPPDYKLVGPFRVRSESVFVDFFDDSQHNKYFPRVDGKDFYLKVRCGLLHQAQTKDNWRVVRAGKFWDSVEKSINRDEFSARLRECFDGYLKELGEGAWDGDVWKAARKKVWWLAKTS